MRLTLVRAVLTASAGALACLVVQALAAQRRAARERVARRERKEAESGWENEGGGLPPPQGVAPR
jgi:hypothetical protein